MLRVAYTSMMTRVQARTSLVIDHFLPDAIVHIARNVSGDFFLILLLYFCVSSVKNDSSYTL